MGLRARIRRSCRGDGICGSGSYVRDLASADIGGSCVCGLGGGVARAATAAVNSVSASLGNLGATPAGSSCSNCLTSAHWEYICRQIR